MTIGRPAAKEYAPYCEAYISKVPPTGPLALLESQLAVFDALTALGDKRAAFRYAPDKWSVKEVLGHMADTERVFAYRLLRFARADATPVPGFEEKEWAAVAPHASRPLADLVSELITVRQSTLALVRSLDATAIARAGTASGQPVTVRALCWIMPGHAQHHLDVLKERYLV